MICSGLCILPVLKGIFAQARGEDSHITSCGLWGEVQRLEPAEFADANQLQSKCLNYPASLSRRPIGIGRTIHASLKHATKILWIVVADQLRDALYR